ncbi:hypothetical protein IIC68_04170 [archaeon]|nr:hypothetical protein [archaeon]
MELIIFLFVSAAACTNKQETRILNRYKEDIPIDKKKEFWDNENVSFITVYATALPVPEKKKASDFSKLPEKAQKAYIEQITKLIMHSMDAGTESKEISKNPDTFNEDIKKLNSALVSPFTEKKSAPTMTLEEDYSRVTFKRMFVFSVIEEKFLPADRIDRMKITITLPEKMVFTKWSGLENKYETITPGTVKSTQKDTTSFSLNLQAPGPVPISAGFSSTSENTLNETLNLSFKRVSLTGGLEPGSNMAFVVQKGAFGFDLSGVVKIDTTFHLENSKDYVTVRKFSKLFRNVTEPDEQKTDVPVAPKKITYSTRNIHYMPSSFCPIDEMQLQADYTFKADPRLVLHGDKSLFEGDDTLEYRPPTEFEGKDKIQLETRENLELYTFEIQTGTQRVICKAANPSEEFACDGYLRFETYDEALDFLNWLINVDTTKEPTGLPKSNIGDGRSSFKLILDEKGENEKTGPDEFYVASVRKNQCQPKPSE